MPADIVINDSSTYGINNRSNSDTGGSVGGNTNTNTNTTNHDDNIIDYVSSTVQFSSSSNSLNLIYDEPVSHISALNEDDQLLAKQGYRAVLSRGFNGLMNFSFCFTAVAVISSITGEYTYGLGTGGPAVLINGWIICSFFTILIGSIMAEICSVYPNAGSVYYWSGMLAPKKWSPFSSFITGWFNLLGNAAGDAAYAFAFGSVLFEMLGYAYPDNSLWGSDSASKDAINVQVGFGIAVAVVWMLINFLPIRIQGWINNIGALWQVGAAFLIIIVLLACAHGNTQTASFVFTQLNNETGLNDPEGVGYYTTGTMIYLGCIGLLTSLFSFSGYEAGGHVAEETVKANRSAPMGILMCCIVSALCGFAYLLGLLFNTFYDSSGSLTSQDVITIFINVLGQQGGLALAAILLVNIFFSGIASLTVTTRIMFAMARDGAIPYGHIVAYVHRSTRTPVITVILVAICDIVLVCLCIGATQAFYAITGLTTIGYQISYAIPITLRLTNKSFTKGVFHLGQWSHTVGWISVVWLIVTSIFFFWPTAFPVNAQNMNYTCVVVGAVFIFAMSYWIVSARHNFTGPLGRAEKFNRDMEEYEKQQQLLHADKNVYNKTIDISDGDKPNELVDTTTEKHSPLHYDYRNDIVV